MRSAAPVLAVSLALIQLPGSAPAQNLVANPALVRDLPPPGWLADRRADWTAHHPVYQAKCRTPDVAAEIEFLNRVVGRDENLLNLAGHPPQDNSALAREAELAHREMPMLRNDIAAADGLVTQLGALPACAAPLAQAAASAPSPSPPPAPPAPPPAAGPAATAPPASPPATEPAAAPAKPERATIPAASGSPPVFVIRFDDRVAALTPLGIRAFHQAVDAVHAGKKVQIAIEGCGAAADFSSGSACAKQRASLLHQLTAAGVKDPRSLFAQPPVNDR